MTCLFDGLDLAVLLVVKAGVVVLVALGTTRLLARAQAARRHAVWATAVVVILLLPLLSLLGRRVAIPVPAPRAKPVSTTPAANSHWAAGQPSGTTVREATQVRAPVWQVPWTVIAWGGYLAGVLLVLIPLGTGVWRAHRMARGATPIDSHRDWQRALKALTTPRMFSKVSLVTSSEIATPVTFGLLRPVVLLPDDVTTWSSRQLHDALVHEFAHVTRFDWGFQIIGVLTCALHWFNPLAWMAARRLELEAERACDERVVQRGASPHDYAEQLVALSRTRAAKQLHMTIALSRRSSLANRVNALLSYKESTMKSKLCLTVIAVVVTAAGLLLAPLEPVTATGYESARHAATLSPLMQAVIEGNVDDVSRIIGNGADANERVDGQGTPLILAAAYGHMEVAGLLIEAGADVNQSETKTPRDLMRTPLTAAARNGHRGIVEVLLDHGADIDAAPRGDATALMEAAQNGHEEIVALLIQKGADVNLIIEGDGNAMIASTRSGNVNIAKMIVRAGADVNAGVPGDGNALIAAVRSGNRKMVEYLMAQGADPSAYVPGDETALTAAAEAGDNELLRLMLNAD